MSIVSFRATSLAILMAAITVSATAQPAQSPSQAQMKATVRAYFEARNAGDMNKARSLFSDEATIEDPFGSPLKTVDQFLGGGRGGGNAARLTFDIVLITGTNTNTAAAAINLKFGTGILTAIEIFAFNPDGKISSMKAYWGSEDRK